MTEENIISDLQAWFVANTGDSVGKDQPYLATGRFDSFDLIVLISHIESSYQITFSSEDFLASDFGTFSGLARIIQIRRASGG